MNFSEFEKISQNLQTNENWRRIRYSSIHHVIIIGASNEENLNYGEQYDSVLRSFNRIFPLVKAMHSFPFTGEKYRLGRHFKEHIAILLIL